MVAMAGQVRGVRGVRGKERMRRNSIDGSDERLYYLTDANMNVTCLVDDAGDAVERYVYDPYGKVTIYDDDWSETRSASSYDNSILYCGYYRDAETGLFSVRNRVYIPALGWVQREPGGMYRDGMSLYEYVRNNPVLHRDQRGLECCKDQCIWGKVRNKKVGTIGLSPKFGKFSPGAVGHAELAINSAQKIALLQSATGAAGTATKVATGLGTATSSVASHGAGKVGSGVASPVDVGALVEQIKGFKPALMEAYGVVIWVEIEYEKCYWERCCPVCWWGYNNWHDETYWHKCSAGSGNAPVPDSMRRGFRYDEMNKISKALGKCMVEALNAVK